MPRTNVRVLFVFLLVLHLSVVCWAFIPVRISKAVVSVSTTPQRLIHRHHWHLHSTTTPESSSKLAFIIVDHGSRKAEANNMLIDLVQRYKKQYNVDIVEAAHMELAEPSISVAFRKCVEQGARQIICHPFFLSRGRHVQEDIPGLLQAAADEFPELKISYTITEPLGAYDQILDLMHHAITTTTVEKR